jgi:hypothetical protein
VAYALVTEFGQVVAAQAKNITQANVTHADIGTWCFSGLAGGCLHRGNDTFLADYGFYVAFN